MANKVVISTMDLRLSLGKKIQKSFIQDDGCTNTYVFQLTETGTGFAVAWQVSTTFVRPMYQLLS